MKLAHRADGSLYGYYDNSGTLHEGLAGYDGSDIAPIVETEQGEAARRANALGLCGMGGGCDGPPVAALVKERRKSSRPDPVLPTESQEPSIWDRAVWRAKSLATGGGSWWEYGAAAGAGYLLYKLVRR